MISFEYDSIPFNNSLLKLIIIMQSNGLSYKIYDIGKYPEGYFPINTVIDGYCVGISDIGNPNFEDRNIIVVPLFEMDNNLDFSGCVKRCIENTNDMSWYLNGTDIYEHGSKNFASSIYEYMNYSGIINRIIVFYSDEKSLIKWKLRV